MLDNIKKQIEFIKIRTSMICPTSDRIWFWSIPINGQIERRVFSKKFYDDIIKDIEFMDENQFILAYGRDPFSLNKHQNYINTISEENNVKTRE